LRCTMLSRSNMHRKVKLPGEMPSSSGGAWLDLGHRDSRRHVHDRDCQLLADGALDKRGRRPDLVQ
jgi:hypothetical protein